MSTPFVTGTNKTPEIQGSSTSTPIARRPAQINPKDQLMSYAKAEQAGVFSCCQTILSGICRCLSCMFNTLFCWCKAEKNPLAQVWEDTYRQAKEGQYSYQRETDKMIVSHSLNWQNALNVELCEPPKGKTFDTDGNKTEISVVNRDCLYVAEQLFEENLKPLVLDAGCRSHFGGGYKEGARAQEEEICRRSCLALAVDETLGFQKNKNLYPLPPTCGIYVPRVPVFRAGKDREYAPLDQPFKVDFGIVAAYKDPELDTSVNPPILQGQQLEDTYQMIRTFFHMAYAHGNRSLVIVPVGCGAFKNPPAHICSLFLKVIQEEYPDHFDKIVFSILDDHNTGKTHNPQGNFQPFADQIEKAGGKVIK
jgi:uncharacterized protein (TIGR02452 family)